MLEGLFLIDILDIAHTEEGKTYRGGDREACLTNIKKLAGMIK